MRIKSAECDAPLLKFRRLAPNGPYLSENTSARVIAALITCRLDYCKSLLAGLRAEQTGRLQRGHNSATRLVLSEERKQEHVTPQLNELHWLRAQDSNFCVLSLP